MRKILISFIILIFLVLFSTACMPTMPDKYFVCSSDQECGSGWYCNFASDPPICMQGTNENDVVYYPDSYNDATSSDIFVFDDITLMNSSD